MPVRGANIRRARSPLRRLNVATRKIEASSDDAGEAVGIPNLTGFTHQMLDVGAVAGLRFRNFPVEQGQEIVRATCSVTLSDSDKNDAEGTWYAHAHDNSPTFTTDDGDVDGRTRTTASVAWTTNDLGSIGNTVSSPNLATVLQEVVNRSGYEAGNAVTLFYVHNSATDKVAFYAFDDPTNPEPSLFVEYLQKIPGHFRQEEDKWPPYATASEDNRGFKGGDATSVSYYPATGESHWAHADSRVGTVDPVTGFTTTNGIVKNSVVKREADGDLDGQIYAGAGTDPAWAHPDVGGGFTQMDQTFDGSGTAVADTVVIGWAEPTNFGTVRGEGLILTLNSDGTANVFTEYDLGSSPGNFFVTSAYTDTSFHYIIGMEFVISPLGPFASHYVQRYIRLARAASGSLTNSAVWEWWDGSGWTSTQANAVRLKDSGGRELEGMADITHRPNGDWLLCQQSASSPNIKIYKSTSGPQGPWVPFHLSTIPRRKPLGGSDPPNANTDYWYGFPKFQEWLDWDGQTLCITHSQGTYARVFGEAVGPVHVSQDQPNIVFVSLAQPFFPRMANVAIEFDLANAIKRTRPVGLATETDTALPITQPVGPIGIATETDTAHAITAQKRITLGLATETDTALAITARKLRAIGIATETDTALVITARKLRVLGLATETDTALAILARKLRAIGIATETDTALPITQPAGGVLGIATETDTALAIKAQKLRVLGLAAETDTALAIRTLKLRVLGLALETDTALALGHLKTKQLGLALETDAALAIRALKFRQLGLASEVDTALAIKALKRQQLGVALETSVAHPLVGISTRLIGLATEIDTARPITKIRTLGLAVEIDTALPLFIEDLFGNLPVLLAPGVHERGLTASGMHDRILLAVGVHNA